MHHFYPNPQEWWEWRKVVQNLFSSSHTLTTTDDLLSWSLPNQHIFINFLLLVFPCPKGPVLMWAAIQVQLLPRVSGWLCLWWQSLEKASMYPCTHSIRVCSW
jgi:hypothetical protein